MRTVKEKVADIMAGWETLSASGALAKRLEIALREQDRDTRHACAETVTKVISASLADGGCFPLGIVSGIEHAIMNAKAV